MNERSFRIIDLRASHVEKVVSARWPEVMREQTVRFVTGYLDSRHTGLPGNTGGNDNQIGTLHGVDGTLTLLIGRRRSTGSGVGQETGDLGGSGDVREIGGDLWGKKTKRIQRI